jgi:hypothetical protein
MTAWIMGHDGIVSKRPIYCSRRNSDAPAVRREAEEDWGGERSQSILMSRRLSALAELSAARTTLTVRLQIAR